MKDTDPDRRGELTDAQLDQLLAETNRELLEHVEATSDPSRTLTAIMARDAEQARPARGIRRAAHGLSEVATAAVIMSDRLRAIASAAAPRGDADYALIAITATGAGVTALVTGAVFGWPVIATVAASAAGFVLFATTIRHWHGVVSRRGPDRDPGQALAAIMRSRMGARAIARILAKRGDRSDGAVRVDRQALTLARARARELVRDAPARGRDRALAEVLAQYLDLAINLARRHDRALDRMGGLATDGSGGVRQARALALDRELRSRLTDARALVSSLARALDERQVDVSGADLSRMDINPELLNGAIWTHQTSWPPGVAGQVKAHSTEIRPDVWQVRLGSTPDRDFLTLS